MPDLASSLPLFEFLGVEIIQNAADAALGPGVLKFSADPTGLSMGLTLQGGQVINIADVAVGAQGLSGRLTVDGLSSATPLKATLFDGFTVGLTAFDVTLSNGGIAQSQIAGQFAVPFFTDPSGNSKTVDVELGFDASGGFSVALATAESVNPTTPDGLVQLQYSIGGGTTIEIDVASFEVDPANHRIVISGRLLLTTADLQWPAFELRGLGIDGKGNISIDGGWIDLPNQTGLDFHGFHIALQKLGFGADDGGRWIGFNGDIHLVEGLPLGGSVRGLRINLDTGEVSFAGVNVDFSVSGVLSITGEIDHVHVDAAGPDDLRNAGLLPSLYDQIPSSSGSNVKKIDVFAGEVDVEIEAIPGGLQIEGKFIVGNFNGLSVFFLDLDVDLPAGIPIFLDVSLYGLEGLVASNLEPQPEPNNTWWEWYKYPTTQGGIDTSAAPDYDATDVSKWLASPKQGALALGAGATIGTSVDDGFTVSAAITLILMIPGPVLMLIGKANILSKRISNADQDANFDAMAVYDGGSQTFDLTIDAHYGIPDVLEIDGSAELHVSGSEQPSWFFALGLPPHEKRLKARIFDLFDTDAYFVVGDFGLITGTWTGYQSSWSFGPLAVSLDAYLATLATIQWSPLQIGGGIELHGDIHLDAFGIGLGLTADALLEGCAPNPFYVHGEFSVELDLPWPLPNVGATISLTWGNDDGSTPPLPLALNHVDATSVDHLDANDRPASDHYTLLAHRAGAAGVWPDTTVQYDDPQKPGILKLDPSDPAWRNRLGSFTDLRQILPDLDPNNLGGRYAPAVPQDAHLVLTFAHPVVDLAGFADATPPPQENPVVSLPTSTALPKDDMSDINPNPPSVQFQYQHALLQVAIFQYENNAWQFVCAMPQTDQEKNNPPEGLTWLAGAWQTPTESDPSVKPDPQQQQTQVKIFPYRMLPGEQKSASWAASGSSKTLGTQFIDQDLTFQLDAGLPPATVGKPIPAAIAAGATQPGLAFDCETSSTSGLLHITFTTSIQLTSIVSLILVRVEGGYLSSAPIWSGDGTSFSWETPLGGRPPPIYTAPTEDSNAAWTQTFPAKTPNIQTLTTTLGSSDILILYAINYGLPPVKMAILPEAPALFAVQTVTSIKAGRVNNGPVDFGSVMALPPIVEFAYVQTVSGPGAAALGASSPPPGFQNEPYPSINDPPSLPPPPPGQTPPPPSTFPLGGALKDLQTYAQWSWPEDGAVAAYYGYDVNVEFVESYVNALYAAFSTDGVENYLHFRCVDRNQRYTALQPIAIHVPSLYAANALVAQPAVLQLPAVISAAAAEPPLRVTPEAAAALAQRAKLAPQLLPVPGLNSLPEASSPAAGRLATRSGAFLAGQIAPTAAAEILYLLQEQADAATVGSLWFQPYAPQTRYTMDVVAGAFVGLSRSAPMGSLAAIYSASDATGALSALRAYYAYENALPPLLRVQFTTSRYATFADQMANVGLQLSNASAASAPVRHYVAATDPNGWLADPSNPNVGRLASATANPPGPYSVYLDARNDLVNAAGTFVSDLLEFDANAPYGSAGMLASKRRTAADAWSSFSSATSAVFDGLIAALGRPDLVSNSIRPATAPLPDTELTFFTDASFERILALLFESPEPMLWRRLWKWIEITPDGGASSVVDEKNVFWSADGTRGLLVVQGQPLGKYELTITFQGNIGAEAPCVTTNGAAVSDFVDLGQIDFQRPVIIRRDPSPGATSHRRAGSRG